MTASYYIQKLSLTKHPEGGAFKETYRSSLLLKKENITAEFSNDCNASTAIYFLLQSGEFSAFHKIKSDELWHFYDGSPLSVYEIENDGKLIEHKLGKDLENGETFQCMIKAGNWFGSRVNSPGSFALVGCTVAPGFDFSDFELARRDELISQYPQHASLLMEMTY